MAITVVTNPADFGRIYDTNRLMYKLSSNNYTQPNFRFYINVKVATPSQYPSVWTSIAIIRKRPLSDGTCFFNPAELWSNYLNYDLEIDIDELKEALNSNSWFKFTVVEEYGEPPSFNIPSTVDVTPIMLYNGLQEYIPYDIEEYGGGNNQWVMSGVTITSNRWIDCGDWVTETGTHGVGEIKFIGDGITGLTSIIISYTDANEPTQTNAQAGCLNNIGTDEYVKFTNIGDPNEYFIITYGNKTNEETKLTWTDITYYEKGSTMSWGGFTQGDIVDLDYTEFDETYGQGKFLTDALDFQVDTNDYANLYYIASYQDKPTYARIRVYYWTDGMGISPGPGGGGNTQLDSYVNNSSYIDRYINVAESAPNPTLRTSQPPSPVTGTTGSGEPPKPIYKYWISSYSTGYTLSYTTAYNQMFYIPTGPQELNDLNVFDRANADGGWVSYKIDLVDSIVRPTKIYNTYPVYYYRKAKCDKYDPWQLFWLNPHGGFDTYTFYKKNYIEYDVKQTRWQHRFSDTYTLGERGTTVYKTLANKKVVLNTDYLTASEAQILSQLQMSPEIYATYDYGEVIYKIPYVIEDTKFQYKEIKNEKMVTYEITIIPAWSRVSQTS